MPVNFSDWIRNEREKRGLLAQELALLAGIDRSKLSRIENHKAHATISAAVEICRVFDMDMNALLVALSEGKYEPPPKPDGVTKLRPLLTEVLVLRYLTVVTPAKWQRAFDLLGQVWWEVEETIPHVAKRFIGHPINGTDVSRYLCEHTSFTVEFMPSLPFNDLGVNGLELIYFSGGVMEAKEVGGYLLDLLSEHGEIGKTARDRLRKTVFPSKKARGFDIDVDRIWEIEEEAHGTRYFWQMNWDIVRFANRVAALPQEIVDLQSLVNFMVRLFRVRELRSGDDLTWLQRFEADLSSLEHVSD